MVPIGEERVSVEYAARSGAHRIEIGPSRAEFQVVMLGQTPPAIEVVRS